jgi:hypothetical protein
MAPPVKSKLPSRGPRKDVLASLRMAQIEVSKPVLPAGKHASNLPLSASVPRETP